MLRKHRGNCLVHVGAGLSTSAGIRDFRGKNGVWTELLKKSTVELENDTGCVDDKQVETTGTNSGASLKLKPDPQSDASQQTSQQKQQQNEQRPQEGKASAKPFDETEPTTGHMVLRALCEEGYVRHIVSQNVDGLFLKSNLSRRYLSELHGDFYLDECTRCRFRFIRSTASKTMRLHKSNQKCPRSNIHGDDKQTSPILETPVALASNTRASVGGCKGYLRDTILDWESAIPFNELRVATRESKRCHLHICIGTSLQLSPSKDLVCKPDKLRKLVVVNLQQTKFDSQATVKISYYSDYVLSELADKLAIQTPAYDIGLDPTKDPERVGRPWLK